GARGRSQRRPAGTGTTAGRSQPDSGRGAAAGAGVAGAVGLAGTGAGSPPLDTSTGAGFPADAYFFQGSEKSDFFGLQPRRSKRRRLYFARFPDRQDRLRYALGRTG